MLHRSEAERLVVISRPAHAWISGQLADAWGNRELGLEEVSIELRLAAAQHDIAWLDWEAAPTLNHDTGLPYTFSQLPTLQHLDLWKMATPRALAYGHLPAALISMHGTYLYERYHNFDADSEEEAGAARAFLLAEKAFQESALERIRQLHGCTEVAVSRLRQLVSTWDAMSLALCMGISDERVFSGIPTTDGTLDLRFTPIDDSKSKFGVSPWPFGVNELKLKCEGRILDGTFSDTTSMRDALRAAASIGIGVHLARA